jgi:hypothetical protein
MIGKTGFAVVAALLVVGSATGAAEAAVCKSGKVSALGKWSATMTGARISARYAWKRKARAKYGPRYDTWWRSADKSYGCWSYEGRERCRVKARPCRAGN